jgi:nucleoid DNA-binding protein
MITPFIIRALLEENSVIITGLGIFSLTKLSSQIKEDIVYPPHNIVEFEYSTDIEGFDFVSKLSKWEQIRIDDAQAKILDWLHLLEKGLEHNKSVFFENFGTFSKELSGKIIFQSMLIEQLNIENEGFEPVCLLPHHRKQILQNIQEQPIKDKRAFFIRRKKKREKIWFALTIAAVALFLFVLFFKYSIIQLYQIVSTKIEVALAKEKESTCTTAHIINNENNTETICIDAIENETVDNSHETVGNINDAENHSSESDSKYLTYQAGKFYVIAGSFTKEEDAFRHIKEKKLEKYHAKIVIQSQNSRRRVCIGVFDNEQDAEKFAAQTDKNYWVLR